MAKIKVGLVQMTCTIDSNLNLRKAFAQIQGAAAKGAKIVCLQEMFAIPYFSPEDWDHAKLAETIPGPATDILCELASELDVVIVASLLEKVLDGNIYSSIVVIDSNGLSIDSYRQMHVPLIATAVSEELRITPGNQGYKVFNTKYANIGVLVGWDQWFPEAARITALMGAEILFCPSASGWPVALDGEARADEFDAWQATQRAHSVANGIHVISVNRVGQENGVDFWGGSTITNAFGRIIHQSSHDLEETPVQELNLSETAGIRIHWPFSGTEGSTLMIR